MRRMPILCRSCLLWRKEDVLLPHYAVLVGISSGYPPAQGRLHTFYSPVRRSPAAEASFSPAAPRLACVKPVASVHPEPGSNSSLLFILSFSFFRNQARHLFNVLLSQTVAPGSIVPRSALPTNLSEMGSRPLSELSAWLISFKNWLESFLALVLLLSIVNLSMSYFCASAGGLFFGRRKTLQR